MSRRVLSAIVGVLIVSVLLTSGCSPKQMTLNYSSQPELKYRVTQEVAKEVIFDQPSQNKSKTDTVKTIISIEFTQDVLGVSDEGATLLDITITDLKYFSRGKTGVNTDFDYARESDKKKPLAALVGQSYKIEVAADGAVRVVDASEARKVCKARQLKALLSDDAIVARHKNYYYAGTQDLKKGASWSEVVSSPKGSLDKKNFEKVYTLDKIEKEGDAEIAYVNMNAEVTNEKPTDASDDSGASGLGFMANIFDNTNTYTGKLVFDLTEGIPVSYKESLVAEYVAAEEPRDGDKTKGPDVLTMRFTSDYAIELVK